MRRRALLLLLLTSLLWVAWAATLDVGVLGAGSHVLEVTAEDAAGRTITRARSFVVE